MPRLSLTARIETWPIDGTFTISRGAKREAVVVVAEITDGMHVGRGECVPYPRYGETPEATLAAILSCADRLDSGVPPGLTSAAARNALDCALWDLRARQSGRRAFELAGLPAPMPLVTCYTLSLAAPHEMAAKAASVPHLPLLKLKLGGSQDAERMQAVRRARPDARLVADANEGWRADDLERLLAVAADCGLETIEQPLPAGADDVLSRILHPVPITADESAHAQ